MTPGAGGLVGIIGRVPAAAENEEPVAGVLYRRFVPNVDHRDDDGLIDFRSNLRRATTSQNGRNQRIGPRNRPGFKGVSWAKHVQEGRANIKAEGRRVHLGYFTEPRAASVACNEAALRFFGEFTLLQD